MLNLFLSCDENYAPHLATTITSIILNCPTPEHLNFIIGDAGLRPTSIEKLEKFIVENKSSVSFVYLDETKFEGLKIKRYGLSIYFRFYLNELIDSHIETILCIDCDTIVVEDLLKINELTKDNNFVLAAVENIGRSPCKKLNLNKGDYFNCGLMLINMNEWRKKHLGKRALAFLLNYPELCPHNEQCALNKIMEGDWLRLPLRWNAQRPAYKNIEKRMYEQHRAKSEFIESIQNPVMIHYMGKRSKPWNYGSMHPLKDIYFYYRVKTP